MHRSQPVLALLLAAIFLRLEVHVASSQDVEGCTTEEMRNAAVYDRLEDLGCDNYTCGIHKIHL